MAKAKAKAAVKRKPVKAPARAAAATKSAAPKPAKASVAKTKAAKTGATKAPVAKAAAAKTAVAKTSAAKPAVTKVTIAKIDADQAPLVKTVAAIKTHDAKAAPVAASAPRSTQQLTLPGAKAAEAPAVKPQPIVRKVTDAQRADLPPPDGFTLLVDGHFKNSFDDLKGAKAAASELKGRFPMLRVEIYDAVKKARLPA